VANHSQFPLSSFHSQFPEKYSKLREQIANPFPLSTPPKTPVDIVGDVQGSLQMLCLTAFLPGISSLLSVCDIDHTVWTISWAKLHLKGQREEFLRNLIYSCLQECNACCYTNTFLHLYIFSDCHFLIFLVPRWIVRNVPKLYLQGLQTGKLLLRLWGNPADSSMNTYFNDWQL